MQNIEVQDSILEYHHQTFLYLRKKNHFVEDMTIYLLHTVPIVYQWTMKKKSMTYRISTSKRRKMRNS